MLIWASLTKDFKNASLFSSRNITVFSILSKWRKGLPKCNKTSPLSDTHSKWFVEKYQLVWEKWVIYVYHIARSSSLLCSVCYFSPFYFFQSELFLSFTSDNCAYSCTSLDWQCLQWSLHLLPACEGVRSSSRIHCSAYFCLRA